MAAQSPFPPTSPPSRAGANDRDSPPADQERLSLALTAGRLGVWDWDLATNEIAYSPVARAIFGFAPDEAVSFAMVRDATYPEDLPRTLPMSRRATDPALREDLPYEYRIIRADGELRWVHARGRAVFEGEGAGARAVRYIGTIQDITEEKAVALALEKSEARLRLAMETGRMAVLEINAHNHLRSSPELNRLMGLPEDETPSLERLRQLYLPGEQERVQAEVRASIAAGQNPCDVEFRCRRPNGELCWLLLRAEVRFDAAGAPAGVTGVLIDITDRRSAEAALRESEERLRALADNLPGGMIFQIVRKPDFEPRFSFVSSSCERLNGVSAAQAMADPGALYGLIAPEDLPEFLAAERRAEAEGTPFDAEVRMRRPDGSWRWQKISSAARRLADGTLISDGIQIDVDERRRTEDALRANEEALQALNATLERRVAEAVAERSKAEDALRQAQKMEAVGQLTGGVAHDFNNLLTVIIGGLDTILRSGLRDEGKVRRAADMALQGAQRAASLTTRLLAFSRRQPLEPKPCDVNALVRDMTELLHRTLGETVELECVLADNLWPVEIDRNQLEASILNLALNARDAMPTGGRLTIETSNVEVGAAAAEPDMALGQYVAIHVGDNGEGMAAQTRDRAFEPFFTTKEVGKGTGLGLSMVYGFAKQSLGHISLSSQEGRGTIVRLCFPRHLGEVGSSARLGAGPAPRARAGEVVLIVEDNDEVRDYGAGVLEELGYGVLRAAHAEAALAILASDARIDLLFTDVVLPGKGGHVLAEQAARLRPTLPILYTTGYARDAIVHDGRLDKGVRLITKPFTHDQLAARLRAVLDAPRQAMDQRHPSAHAGEGVGGADG